jgi:peptide/nickel transport system substrate-binding protein
MVKEVEVRVEVPVERPVFREAPILAAMVAEGKLPPVDQRVPSEPAVGMGRVPGDWLDPEVGSYGGTLNLVSAGFGGPGGDGGWLVRNEFWLDKEGLAYDPDTVIGNVLKGFDMSPDGKVFTFHMRKGMKFSNGEPFTSASAKFWYDAIFTNDKLNASPNQYFRSGLRTDGTPLSLEVVDDYTFKIIFDEPTPAFPSVVTYGYSPIFRSPAFLGQFHPDYTPMEQIEPLIAERGFEPGEWWRLFTYNRDWLNMGETGQPWLGPFVLTEKSQTRFVFERNPYFWRVDAAGQQLPYVDRVVVDAVGDNEAALLKIIAGEVDLAVHPVQAKNVALYQQFADEKGYNVNIYNIHASLAEVFLNLSNPDPVWRQVVQDLRFRTAMSLATDRQRVIDAIYFGLAGMPRVIPLNTYDKTEAMRLLDEMGMDQMDSEGCRIGPDGNKFLVPWDVPTFNGDEVATAELVSSMWKEVGICSDVKKVSNDLFLELNAANATKALVWWTHYPRWPWHETDGYVGREWQTTWGGAWFNHYLTQGAKGEEGPAEYLALRELQNQLFAETDPAKQDAIWEDIKQNITDNVWWIPIVDDVKIPTIFNKRLGNVPEDGVHIVILRSATNMFFRP